MKTLLLTFVLAAQLYAADATRPNIILIMADDMGFSDIGCYGGEIHTPNIDRLAHEGLRFTQFYNNAKCTTSRASLLSGMYPRGSGDNIPLNIATIGEQMLAAGYQTAMSGKWHLGSKAPQRPFDRGFNSYYGLMDGCCNFFNPAQPDPPFKGGKVRVFGEDDQLIKDFPPGYYTTDAFTDHAITDIRRFTETKKPFFLHLAYTAPHYPLHAPPEDIAKYRGKYKMGWEELRKQRHARQIEMKIVDPKWPLSPTDSKAYPWESANRDWEDLRMATYAAMIDRMDQNIGRLLQTLDDLKISNNTLVLFLSDNGGCTEEPGGRNPKAEPGIASTYTAVGPAWGWAQNTPFRRYKSWANEGGISTPLIARWPGTIQPNTFTNEVGHIIDIVPTCLDVAGSKPLPSIHDQPTQPIEGLTLNPILRGATRTPHEQLCWEWSGNAAIRQGPWKLVWDTLSKPEQWQLFNLDEDRTELHNLAPEHPEKVTQLRLAYEKWAESTLREMPTPK